MDLHQYGGRRGTSINHYLIDFISYILYNQDLNEPLAVLTAMIDFKKAFNRQNHSILVTKLGDMGVPGWLLNIVVGFLTDRELVVSYKREQSESKVCLVVALKEQCWTCSFSYYLSMMRVSRRKIWT